MYISIDLGGTNTRIASSENLKDILEFEMFPSDKDINTQISNIESTIDKIRQGKNIQAIAIGVAGILDLKREIVVRSPNYQTLDGLKFSDILGKYGKTRILAMNDTQMAGLGEAVLGAGQKQSRVGYIALGTGVGGALIVDGEIDIMRKYEPGHQIINFSGTEQDKLDIAGTAEAYLSGISFKKIYGKLPHECNDTQIWEEYGKRVGILVNNVIFMWDVDCIVLGGGMCKHFSKFYPTLKSAPFNNFSFREKIIVAEAKFGQGSGITGGFVLLSRI